MREILFKAKRKSWKELPKEEWWVEGYLFDDGMPEPKHYFIGGIIVKPYEGTACDKWNVIGIDFCEIDINTLCQYTGLTDKNDKKIWENDILRYSYDYDGSPFLKDGEEIKYRVGAVFWSEWRGSWAVCGRGNKKYTNNDVFKYNRNPNRTEVIGNIFDNPELLEVE